MTHKENILWSYFSMSVYYVTMLLCYYVQSYTSFYHDRTPTWHELHQGNDQQQIGAQRPSDPLGGEALVHVDEVGHQGAAHLRREASMGPTAAGFL